MTMPRTAVIALILVSALTAAPTRAGGDSAQAPGTYITLTSPEGTARLARSAHATDYLPLSTTFATQITQTFCSVATGVTVLNALSVPRPVDPVYAPYAYFTQNNYFNDAVTAIRNRDLTRSDGMTLDMAARAMRIHGARTVPHHAEDGTLDEFRQRASANLKRPGDFVVINYQRKFIGQPKGAHFSPLGAYDAATDTFLILDVARYKFPPVWVRAEDLFAAMNTQDSEIARSRGYILVSNP